MPQRLLVFVLFVFGLLVPTIASARTPRYAGTRVGAFDLAVHLGIGLCVDQAAEKHRGIDFTCDEIASGSPHAAKAGSVGAMSASEKLLNWSPKSTPTWGHTFLTHGQGAKVTRSLIGRAARTGEPQGQWLSNQAAADFLSAERAYIQGPTAVRLPVGVGAQIILPNGTIAPAGHALLVPAPGGGFVTAFPFLP